MFSDLLNETKDFKYQITPKVKKYKHDGAIKFESFYFNSVTKTVTNWIRKLFSRNFINDWCLH